MRRFGKSSIAAWMLLLLALVTSTAWRSAKTALPPVVDVASVNPGAIIERDLCLTISLGDAAASECGDLRLVHPLPSVRTLSKERAPVLIYSSQSARPTPIVAANVSLPSGTSGLSRVVATLKINGLQRARGVWTGANWPSAAVARIALTYDASSDPTSISRYSLDVTAYYGETAATTTVAGDLAVVNRRASYFGSGWWLAGLDQLLLDSQGQPAVWVGGDGSVSRYKVAGTAWTAPTLDRPDTLIRDGSGYMRILSGGVKVRFDSLGRHIATRNRLGYETTFSYDAGGRLSQITVPFAPSSYQFFYNLAGQLDSVKSPANPGQTRKTTIYQNGARVDSIMDSDTTRVRFYYLNTTSGVITRRKDRIGASVAFTFDSAQKLVASNTKLNSTDSIYTTIKPKETLGISIAGVGAVDTAVAYTRLDGPRTDVADTTLFWLDKFGAPVKVRDAVGGVTTVTHGDPRFPALATRVVDAVGMTTDAQYDARGNPSSITAENPYGDGRNAVTNYVWHQTWDEVTSITLPEGEITTFGYDPTNGNRLWEQQGTNSARRVTFNYGNSFSLVSSIVVPDIAGRDSIEYDTRGNPSATLTPSGYRSSYYTDLIGRDTFRIEPIDSAHSSHERITYDLADRVKTSTAFGPQMPKTPTFQSRPAVADSVIVTNTYDAEGNLLQISRSRGVLYPGYAALSSYYTYDSAGRKITQALFGTIEKYTYDPAGNVAKWITPLSDTVLMSYDAANRLVQRVVPQKNYSSLNCAFIPIDGGCFFTFPEREGPTLCFAADTSTFAYDAAGRIVRADNGSARVRRSYFLGGALKTDTLRTAKYARPCAPMPPDDNFASHIYGLSFTYDLDGRRKTLTHPAQFCAPNNCVESYGYDHDISALDTVVDVRSNRHTFTYDLAGRVATRNSPGSVVDAYTYDAESNLIAHSVTHSGQRYLSDSSTFDRRGKMVTAHTDSPAGSADILLSYSGLGAVTASEQQGTIGGFSTEEFIVDALGNRVERRQTSEAIEAGDPERYRTFTYNSDGQLTGIDALPPTSPYYFEYWERYSYDGAGNTYVFHRKTNASSGGGDMTYAKPLDRGRLGSENMRVGGPSAADVEVGGESPSTTGPIQHDSHISYYDADNKLRVFNRHIGIGPLSADSAYGLRGTFDEYRYDALGRRVLSRARRIGTRCPATIDCESRAVRTIWDGDRILYEIRSPGGEIYRDSLTPPDTIPDPAIESEASLVSYTHAPGISGIDEPIAIHRNGIQSIFPHTGWRGMLAMGTYANGERSDCGVASPCDQIDWPAVNVTVDGGGYNRPEPFTWFGSLASTGTEGSGLQYMRNRYYDPKRGQFTQADPIGLAGGLNLYGFAAGDAVTYSDPFGLFDCHKVKCPRTPVELVEKRQIRQIASDLLVASEADAGREYGAHIVKDSNGKLRVANVTRGAVGLAVGLPDAPDNAVAEIHTHPDQALGGGLRITFDFPSGRDAGRANKSHIYGVVVTPRKLLVVPIDQFAYQAFRWTYRSVNKQ